MYPSCSSTLISSCLSCPSLPRFLPRSLAPLLPRSLAPSLLPCLPPSLPACLHPALPPFLSYPYTRTHTQVAWSLFPDNLARPTDIVALFRGTPARGALLPSRQLAWAYPSSCVLLASEVTSMADSHTPGPAAMPSGSCTFNVAAAGSGPYLVALFANSTGAPTGLVGPGGDLLAVTAFELGDLLPEADGLQDFGTSESAGGLKCPSGQYSPNAGGWPPCRPCSGACAACASGSCGVAVCSAATAALCSGAASTKTPPPADQVAGYVADCLAGFATTTTLPTGPTRISTTAPTILVPSAATIMPGYSSTAPSTLISGSLTTARRVVLSSTPPPGNGGGGSSGSGSSGGGSSGGGWSGRLCGDGLVQVLAAPCWSDDWGGIKVCESTVGLVMGGDGRWHHAEECDDGNSAGGDGCSSDCTVEAGYICSSGQPNRCSPAPLPPLRDALPAAAGLLLLTPLSGSGGGAGWADLYLLPAAWSVLPASRPPPRSWLANAGRHAGIYRWNSSLSNDAAAAAAAGGLFDGPLPAAYGDAFVCPCSAAPAGMEVTDRPPASGTAIEAAGVYVEDGVECTWSFGGRGTLRIRPDSVDLASGEVLQLESYMSGSGMCSAAPCPLAAAAGPSISAAGPAALRFISANSSRRLRPQGTSIGAGKFSVDYHYLSISMEGRRDSLNGSPTVSVRGGNAPLSERLPLVHAAMGALKSRISVDTMVEAAGATAGRSEEWWAGSDAPAVTTEGGGWFVLATSVKPDGPRSCGLVTPAESQPAVLRLRAGGEATNLEGVWEGSATAWIVPSGSSAAAASATASQAAVVGKSLDLFQASATSGWCANGNRTAAATTEWCAADCIAAGQSKCGAFSFSATAAECRIYPTCVPDKEAAASCALQYSCSFLSFSTYTRRTDPVSEWPPTAVKATCSASLEVRGGAVRLSTYACVSTGSATAAAGSSMQSGVAEGLLLPCSGMPEGDRDPPTTPAVQACCAPGMCGGQFGAPWYSAARVRWTSSSRDRAVGATETLMYTLPVPLPDPSSPGGGSAEDVIQDVIQVYMVPDLDFPRTKGEWSPFAAAAAPGPASGQMLSLRRAAAAEALPAPVRPAAAALLSALWTCNATLAAVEGAAGSCGHVVRAAFEARNLSDAAGGGLGGLSCAEPCISKVVSLHPCSLLLAVIHCTFRA
jgi:cysteine-rich repeat protein